jgi:interleukin-1 receptor-associated kinase 1
LVLLCFYCAPRGASSLSFSLNFSDPSVPNRGASIDITGDAYFSPSRLELTRNAFDASVYNNTGRASYVHKVPLWNSATGEMASFATNFSFQIIPDKDRLLDTGDGMAFFLGHFPSAIPPNSDGGGLGLLPRLPASSTTGKGASRIVAVEFDTHLNP